MTAATRNAAITAMIGLICGVAVYMTTSVRDAVNSVPLMQQNISIMAKQVDDHEDRIRILEHGRTAR